MVLENLPVLEEIEGQLVKYTDLPAVPNAEQTGNIDGAQAQGKASSKASNGRLDIFGRDPIVSAHVCLFDRRTRQVDQITQDSTRSIYQPWSEVVREQSRIEPATKHLDEK